MASQFQEPSQSSDVRVLGSADAPAVERLLLTRAMVGGEPLDTDETQHVLAAIHRGEIDGVWRWGYFEQNVLLSYLVQVISPRVKTHWNMTFLAVSPGASRYWNYQKNGLDRLWSAAFMLGKSHGRHNVYWSLPERWARTHERTQRTSTVWKRYTVNTLARYDSGEYPTDALHAWIYGERVKRYPVLLREGRPKIQQPLL